jgi:hypothetical protein
LTGDDLKTKSAIKRESPKLEGEKHAISVFQSESSFYSMDSSVGYCDPT